MLQNITILDHFGKSAKKALAEWSLLICTIIYHRITLYKVKLPHKIVLWSTLV